MKQFKSVDIPSSMVDNLDKMGYIEMTPIQEATIEHILKGSDVVAKAKTGSGKSAAFGIPLLLNIDVKKFKPQVLVLTPTRELADQVANELRNLAKFTQNIKILTLCGGVPVRAQISSLSSGAHILVGTPGRIRDHQGKESIDLSEVKSVVLDEADKMLDMGFLDEVSKIISNISKDRQTLLFSATYPSEINKMVNQLMNKPVKVEIDTLHDSIEEHFYNYGELDKNRALLKIFSTFKPKSSIIFCRTKNSVDEVDEFLYNNGFSSTSFHSDYDQIDRDAILISFANMSRPILVATDLAARGIDIKDIELVINYDLPRDRESYTHRIGRGARAGGEGKAATLFTNSEINSLNKLFENEDINVENVKDLPVKENYILSSNLKTVVISGGKRDKFRAGDILGALIHSVGIQNEDIGKIDVKDKFSYVAVRRDVLNRVLNSLRVIKKKKIRVNEL